VCFCCATATSCHTSTTGSGTGTGTRIRSGRRTQQVCEVTWNDGGVVALPSSSWVRVGTLALGVVLLSGGLVLALRRRPT